MFENYVSEIKFLFSEYKYTVNDRLNNKENKLIFFHFNGFNICLKVTIYAKLIYVD